MIGLHVDHRPELQRVFRFALSSAAPDLELRAVEEVPTTGSYDLCVFRMPSSPDDLEALVAQLRCVAKPGAPLFAYADGVPSRAALQQLLRTRCRGGASADNPSELRQLWTEIADQVSDAAKRLPRGLRSTAVSIMDLLTHWQSSMSHAEANQ